MTSSSVVARRPVVPTRQLRLLATWAPLAGVAFALLAVGSAVAAVQDVRIVLDGTVGTGPGSTPVLAVVLGVVLSALVAVVAGRVAYRLGVEVPRVLEGWRTALAERTEALTGP